MCVCLDRESRARSNYIMSNGLADPPCECNYMPHVTFETFKCLIFARTVLFSTNVLSFFKCFGTECSPQPWSKRMNWVPCIN